MNDAPKYLGEFIYNNSIAKRLMTYNKYNLDNIIFHGQNNSGKRSFINALLNHLFKKDLSKIKRLVKRDIKINNTKTSIELIESPHHFELNLYEYGLSDRFIIMSFIRNLINYKSISSQPYKIIVINHFDKTTALAQLALQRIIETSYKTTRFILCCENLNAIDVNLRSRFVPVRIPKPKKPERILYIKTILAEKNKQYTETDISNLLKLSQGCIYNLNLLLNHFICTNTLDIPILSLNLLIQPIIKELYIKNLNSIINIRKHVYNLLLLNISPSLLINLIFKHFLASNLSIKKKHELINIAGILSFDNVKSQYDIFIIEAFVIKIKLLIEKR